MTRLTLPLLIGALILSGCGRFGDSGWNPLGWRGAGASTPETLAPEGGYPTAQDARPAVPQILGAEWQPLSDGRLLVLRGFAPVKAAVLPLSKKPELQPATQSLAAELRGVDIIVGAGGAELLASPGDPLLPYAETLDDPAYADRRGDYLRPMLGCGVLTLLLALLLATATSLPVAVLALVARRT